MCTKFQLQDENALGMWPTAQWLQLIECVH